MSYAVEFNGRVFTPDGEIRAASIGAATPSIAELNREHDAREVEALKRHPERVFLYVKIDQSRPVGMRLASAKLITWMGTVVCERPHIGHSVAQWIGARFVGTKRSVEATIFGQRYYGWYYESSGGYCRLKRAK